MAATLTMWEQSGQFDPTNPNQISRTRYTAIPGGYGTFYYNKVPSTAQLLGVTDPSTWSPLVQTLVVGVLGLAGGFFVTKHYGAKIKQKLGLSGHRRRRR